jgi:DNA polymerase-3 subunit gamma/tau
VIERDLSSISASEPQAIQVIQTNATETGTSTNPSELPGLNAGIPAAPDLGNIEISASAAIPEGAGGFSPRNNARREGGTSAPEEASSGHDLDAVITAVAQSLASGGHATAATLLEGGKWTIEGGVVRMEVDCKAKMIKLTFNAAAEKLIRQGLTEAGAPTRFMILPGEGLATPGVQRVRAPLGSIEQEARNHPLVLEAMSLFNADIVSVIDLRRD